MDTLEKGTPVTVLGEKYPGKIVGKPQRNGRRESIAVSFANGRTMRVRLGNVRPIGFS
jgi:hypothetical protein